MLGIELHLQWMLIRTASGIIHECLHNQTSNREIQNAGNNSTACTYVLMQQHLLIIKTLLYSRIHQYYINIQILHFTRLMFSLQIYRIQVSLKWLNIK